MKEEMNRLENDPDVRAKLTINSFKMLVDDYERSLEWIKQLESTIKNVEALIQAQPKFL
jgi:hypothetical protein